MNRLMEIRKKYFLELLFLMETMHTRNDLVDIQVWLGYDHVHNVNSVGRSGSLAVFWKNSGIVNILSSNKNLVDLNVQFGDKKFFCFLYIW